MMCGSSAAWQLKGNYINSTTGLHEWDSTVDEALIDYACLSTLWSVFLSVIHGTWAH